MLPKTGGILRQDFKVRSQPSKTYKVDWRTNRIYGQIDGLDAVRQAVYGILHTERFDYAIHSWNYGFEGNRLFGGSLSLVKSKVKKRIEEALTQDDRIQKVDSFLFVQKGSKLQVNFLVHTKLGEIKAAKEVEI